MAEVKPVDPDRGDSDVRRISAFQAVRFAALSLPLAVLDVPITLYVGPLYGEELGLGLAQVGIVFMVVRCCDALLDVFVGRWSDRTRSRYGRRKPWIAAGLPLMVVSSLAIANPPSVPTAWYFAGSVLVFYIASTFVIIPHLSWGQDLGATADERSRMSGFRETGTIIGTLLAASVPMLVEAGPGEGTAGHAVRVLTVTAVAAAALAGPLALFTVPDRAIGAAAHPSLRDLFALLRSPLFAAAMGALLLMTTGVGLFNGAVLLLVEQDLGLNGWFMPFVFVQYTVALVAIPLVVPITRRLGQSRALALGLTGFALTLAILALALPSVPALFAAAVLLGCASSFMITVSPALIAEFAARRRLAEGVDRTGEHLALYNFLTKIGAAGGVGGGLALIGYLRPTLEAAGPFTAVRAVSCYLTFLCQLVAIVLLLWVGRRLASPDRAV